MRWPRIISFTATNISYARNQTPASRIRRFNNRVESQQRCSLFERFNRSAVVDEDQESGAPREGGC